MYGRVVHAKAVGFLVRLDETIDGMGETNLSEQLFVFTGSYSEADEPGIGVYTFDEDSGQLTKTGEVAGFKNPTFLNVDAGRRLLYAISETVNEDGARIGEAAAFAIDAGRGTIRLLNRKPTTAATTCHIQRDADNRYLTVTSYHGGMVGLLRLEEDGSVGELADVSQHSGSSVRPAQDRPHPHSSFYSPDGRYLFVQDLGLDQIVTYSVDQDRHALVRLGETNIHGGAGPRHMAFHPAAPYAYVINELDSSVTALAYDSASGSLRVLDTVSTLPADYKGDNGCAEIAISKDGRFVYGSNRGHDSIVVFATEPDSGLLRTVQHIPTEGGHPRHFALTPSGKHLIAANRDGNNLVVFEVDRDNGRLRFTGQSAEASKPVCVIPVYLTV